MFSKGLPASENSAGPEIFGKPSFSKNKLSYVSGEKNTWEITAVTKLNKIIIFMFSFLKNLKNVSFTISVGLSGWLSMPELDSD